jgi:transposase
VDGETMVTVGVDTHTDVHVAAVLDSAGRLLETRPFPATTRGYAQLATWTESFGRVDKVGMEGTGSFGAGLLRFLADYGLTVIEVDRPDRAGRRRNGKSDPLDAESAARAVQSGRATGTPKSRDAQVEMIRVLRVARRGAMKARIQAGAQTSSPSARIGHRPTRLWSDVVVKLAPLDSQLGNWIVMPPVTSTLQVDRHVRVCVSTRRIPF